MVDEPETPDPILSSKRPARVTPSSETRKAPARKAAAKKAPAKKAPAKKAPAKKAAAKKAPAKKAPAKKAPAKKAPAKKAPAKKAPAKKAPAKKAPAKKAPIKKAAPVRPVADRSEPVVNAPHLTVVPDRPEPKRPVSGLARRGSAPGDRAQSDRWAMCASITEELLNDLVLFVVGEGVLLEPLETSVAMPAMGEVDVRLALTITSASFDLRSDDGGRARVVVCADGDVSTRTAAYDGETVDTPAGPMGLPTPPAPIPVRVEALVTPFLDIGADGQGAIGLDLDGAELISLSTDSSAPVPEGVDPAAWSGILQMFSMVFGVLGAGLFESLGEHLGAAGVNLPREAVELLTGVGVAEGRADVSVSSGLISLGLGATDDVRGRALPVPIAGKRVGIGLASSVVDHFCQLLIERAAGDLPLPFELDVDLGEQRVGGRLRQARVLPATFPDIRSSIRTEIRPRLLRGRLELSVQSAWIELPSLMPSIFNQVSRRLGELVSLAPVRMRFPARIELPVIPDSTDTVPVEIDDLRVTTDGLGLVIALV